MADMGALNSRDSFEDTLETEVDAPRVVLSAAQRGLVKDHLPLVGHIVYQVSVNFPRHVEREELKMAGSLGLVEAATRYDEAVGVPFERYAAQRVRGAILDQLRAMDWAPRSVRHFNRIVERTEQRLASELGGAPSTEQLADAMGMSVEELRKLQVKASRGVVLALEYDVNDGNEDLTLSEVLSNPDQKDALGEIEDRELRALVIDACRALPDKQRYAVVSYFLEGISSEKIAKDLGVTESRVSQLKNEGLEMIRHVLGTQYEEMGDLEITSRSDIVQRRLGYYTDRALRFSSRDERLAGHQMTSKLETPTEKLPKRAEIVSRGKVTRQLHPVELRKVFAYFLFNDNSRLEELRRANPTFDYIDMARFARIRRRISKDLAVRGVDIKWDTEGRTRGTRYTIRILKGAEELEALVYGNNVR